MPGAPTPFAHGLRNNRAGRILADHLAAVEVAAKTGGHSSAASESIGNERVFIHALGAWIYGKRGRPCGLPAPLPSFIAILNLSGERLMVYSEQPDLITSLCRYSSALRPSELAERLKAFEQYPAAAPDDVNRFVLLTYSMPWQAGTDAVFWHLSACSLSIDVGKDGATPFLADRVLAFSGTSAGCAKGRPVLDIRDKNLVLSTEQPEFDTLTLKQIEDFEESYSAACLDHMDPPPKLVDVSNESMVGIMKELTRGRAADQSEIRKLSAELLAVNATLACLAGAAEDKEKAVAKEHEKKLQKLRSDHAEEVQLCKKECAALRAEMATMQDALNKSATTQARELKTHDKLQSKFDELKRQSEGKDKLHNAALNKQRAEIAKLESRLEEATSQAATLKARLDKEHASLVMRQQTLHTATLDKVNAALASKERLLNQLSDNNERLSVEALSLKSHDEEQAATIARLEKELAALALSSAEASVKHVGTTMCNASSATHHCASTQTDPTSRAGSPETAAAATKHHPMPAQVPSYQAAVDLLQELVTHTRNNGHAPAQAGGYPNGNNNNGYVTPLPYPHFTPHGIYHGAPPPPTAAPRPAPPRSNNHHHHSKRGN